MRFGVSNLVFNEISAGARNAILNASVICDFAPTMHYGSWECVPDFLPLSPYFAYDTKISALQSMFYGIENASLLKGEGNFSQLIRHYERLVKLAASAKIPFLIYGSPGTRSGRIENLAESDVLTRITQLADIAAFNGVKLCFEVNSPKFGCEFLTTNHALLELLEELAHPGLGLHLDIGQMLEEEIDVIPFLELNLNKLAHLHLSSPDFTFKPNSVLLYEEVLAVVCDAEVDVLLEIQKLGEATEVQLVDAYLQLAALSQK